LTTLGLADKHPTGTAEAALADAQKQQALSGANWFFWIAAFSIINSIVLLANGE